MNDSVNEYIRAWIGKADNDLKNAEPALALLPPLADMLRKKVKEWRDIFGNDTMKIVEVSV